MRVSHRGPCVFVQKESDTNRKMAIGYAQCFHAYECGGPQQIVILNKCSFLHRNLIHCSKMMDALPEEVANRVCPRKKAGPGEPTPSANV
jgi:hypothetical protein